jgi:hypothetical protein
MLQLFRRPIEQIISSALAVTKQFVFGNHHVLFGAAAVALSITSNVALVARLLKENARKIALC